MIDCLFGSIIFLPFFSNYCGIVSNPHIGFCLSYCSVFKEPIARKRLHYVTTLYFYPLSLLFFSLSPFSFISLLSFLFLFFLLPLFSTIYLISFNTSFYPYIWLYIFFHNLFHTKKSACLANTPFLLLNNAIHFFFFLHFFNEFFIATLF